MMIALYLKFQRRIRAGDKMRLGQATANLEFCVSKMYYRSITGYIAVDFFVQKRHRSSSSCLC